MDRMLILFFYLLYAGEATSDHHAHPLTVTAPHIQYFCPEGANVTLECMQEGAKAHPTDQIKHLWLYNPHMDQHCHRNPIQQRKHGNHTRGMMFNSRETSFSVTLLDLTSSDQGRYCCMALDVLQDGKQKHVQHEAHSHFLLTITPRQNNSLRCTMIDYKPPQGSVAAGLATAACIMGILCLPLILVLVYRQRRVHGSRRAHELVRMDSEAQGHENPVFLGESPQPKTRTVSQILSRQMSETGRHLLADPGTPQTPTTHGDVFFPAQEPIPESPTLVQV